MWWHMTAEAMRPVKRVRGSGREIIEFMGDSVDEFSKKGIDYLNLSIYIIHIIYIKIKILFLDKETQISKSFALKC